MGASEDDEKVGLVSYEKVEISVEEESALSPTADEFVDDAKASARVRKSSRKGEKRVTVRDPVAADDVFNLPDSRGSQKEESAARSLFLQHVDLLKSEYDKLSAENQELRGRVLKLKGDAVEAQNLSSRVAKSNPAAKGVGSHRSNMIATSSKVTATSTVDSISKGVVVRDDEPKPSATPPAFLWKLNKDSDGIGAKFKDLTNWRRRCFVVTHHRAHVMHYWSKKEGGCLIPAVTVKKGRNAAFVDKLPVVELDMLDKETEEEVYAGIEDYKQALRDNAPPAACDTTASFVPRRLYPIRLEAHDHTSVVVASETEHGRDLWYDCLYALAKGRVNSLANMPRAGSAMSSMSEDEFAQSLRQAFDRPDAFVRPKPPTVFDYLPRKIGLPLEEIWNKKEPKREGFIADCLRSHHVQMCIFGMIALNFFFTMLRLAMEAAYWETPEKIAGLTYIERAFVICYVLEMLLKLWVHRLYFFWCPDGRWNLFDLCLVLGAGLDTFITSLTLGLPHLRTLRLFRVARYLMLLRAVRFVKELRIMMEQIMGCVGPTLLWGMMMLLFFCIMFGMVFMDKATSMLRTNELAAADAESLQGAFGSWPLTLLTLFKSVSGGDDWGNIYDVVKITGDDMAVIFILFVYFFQCAVFNILMGIFVEKAVQTALPSEEEQMLERVVQEFDDADQLEELCHELDTDDSETINLTEFLARMGNPQFSHFFFMRGLDITNAPFFFKMLTSINDTDELDICTFVQSCMKLRGNATRLDLTLTTYQVNLMQTNLFRFQHMVRDQFHTLRNQLQEVYSAVASISGGETE